jgi:serine/threonine protein kinase
MTIDPERVIAPDLVSVVTDFGLARTRARLRRGSEGSYSMGTPGYVAPKYFKGWILTTVQMSTL